MKRAMFFATLMYSSVVVATSGMPGGFPDQSTDSSSKARLAEVDSESQKSVDKPLDKDALLRSVIECLQQVEKDVGKDGWFSKNVLERVKGSGTCIDMLIEMLSKSEISKNSGQKSSGSMSVATSVSGGISSDRTIRATEPIATGSYVSTNKSPVVKLYEYCQNKSNNLSLSDLRFKYEIKSGNKFNCAIIINDKKYKMDDLACRSKREAKNIVADYTLRKLLEEDLVLDNRSPTEKLNEYSQGEDALIKLSDIYFLYDINNDGTYNCAIKANDKLYDARLQIKSKKEARHAIAGYMYNALRFAEREGVSEKNAFDAFMLMKNEGVSESDAFNALRFADSEGISVKASFDDLKSEAESRRVSMRDAFYVLMLAKRTGISTEDAFNALKSEAESREVSMMNAFYVLMLAKRTGISTEGAFNALKAEVESRRVSMRDAFYVLMLAKRTGISTEDAFNDLKSEAKSREVSREVALHVLILAKRTGISTEDAFNALKSERRNRGVSMRDAFNNLMSEARNKQASSSGANQPE